MISPNSKKKYRTIRPILPSSAIKAQYQKALLELIAEMHNSVTYWIKARYRERLDDIVVASDESAPRSLQKELNRRRSQWRNNFKEHANKQSRKFTSKVHTAVKLQLANSIREKAANFIWEGKKVSRRLNNVIQSTINENIGLISSIPDQYLSQANTIIMQGVKNGRDMGFIVTELEKQCKVAENRAIIIARDQTNKATEAINTAICQDIGITEGIWMHRMGSKVPRSTHMDVLDGEKFTLSEGLYDPDKRVERFISPGELINCHCTYLPIIPGLEGEV